MRLTDDEDKVCKCGHSSLYHGGKCTFRHCNCWKFRDEKEKKKPHPEYFLSGFTYTEDEICTCKHGSWDHFSPKGSKMGRCRHYIQDKKDKWIPCPCKKFVSKIKAKQEVKKWKKKRKRKSTKPARRVKRR